MGTKSETTSYFDAYWRARFDPVLFERRVRTFRKNYAKYLPQSRSARMLEIGPGHGEMLEVLSRSGFENVSALDNDAALVDALRQRNLRATLYVDDVNTFLNSRPGQFDCVMGMHVLEHFDAAAGQALVRAVFNSLAPDGRLILEVPNMANFITAPYARWADYTHRHGYTIESLRALLLTSGFSILASFGVARAIGSVGQLVGHLAQRCTDAMAWALLRANYPRVDIITAPVIGIVGERPGSASNGSR